MSLLTIFLVLVGPFLMVAPPALITWAEFSPRPLRNRRPVAAARATRWGWAS